MDRVKSYSWLLTIVMGLAITNAIKVFTTLLTDPNNQRSDPIAPIFARFIIFIVLAIRWTMGSLWYLDRAYISKPASSLDQYFLLEFFVLFWNIVIFVPLSAVILNPPTAVSRFSAYLNGAFLNGQQASTFIWLLFLLLSYDLFWFLITLALSAVRHKRPRRVQAFWAVLNSLTLIISLAIFLLYAWTKRNAQQAEIIIFFVVLFASVIDILGTVVETSPLSQQLSP